MADKAADGAPLSKSAQKKAKRLAENVSPEPLLANGTLSQKASRGPALLAISEAGSSVLGSTPTSTHMPAVDECSAYTVRSAVLYV